jgi:tRNA nucleotidyltransferase (CCA-adding enzyme)
VSGGGLLQDLTLSDDVLEIARRLEDAGHETWCVGGALRDHLLGHPAEDVDLATGATPDQVQRLFPRTVAIGVKYGTVGVLDRKRVLHEVTTFRKDVSTDGRHAVVAYGVSLEDDLARRDFTINALAFHPFRREWRDPYGGLADLDRRVVRAVGNPGSRFEEDYLRILRAIRFAARFEFEIERGTWAAAVAGAPGLRGLSAERIRDEWFKGLDTARSVARLIDLWRDVGAAAVWIPELATDYPFASASPGRRDPVVLTAGLCRQSAGVLRRLRASNAEIARAERMDSLGREPAGHDATSVRQWLAVVDDAADDLIQLSTYRQGAPPAWAGVVAEVRRRGDATVRGQLAVTGDDLRAAGVPPGPQIGQVLGRLLDAVLEEPARNSREALLALVKSWF